MKRQIITIGLIVVLALSVQLSLIVTSYPGYGGSADCANCHNEPGNAYNSSYMDNTLTLDGNSTEAFWSEETYTRRMMIPVATTFGGDHLMVKTVFAQNSTHLFTLMSWNDPTLNGTDDAAYTAADGVALMFNINVTDFTAANFGGMNTQNAGEAVDVYVWKPDAAANGAHNLTETPDSVIPVTSNTYDYSINYDGWVRTEENNIGMAGIHGALTSFSDGYQIELVRPLVTDDVNDAQFEYHGYYDFAIAIFNSSKAGGHLVSFSHQVYVHNVDPMVTTQTIDTTQTSTVETTTTITEEETASFTAVFAFGMASLFVTGVVFRYNNKKNLKI